MLGVKELICGHSKVLMSLAVKLGCCSQVNHFCLSELCNQGQNMVQLARILKKRCLETMF